MMSTRVIFISHCHSVIVADVQLLKRKKIKVGKKQHDRIPD